MAILEKIYEISPIFLQNLMVSLQGYRNNKSRYGATYHEHRAFLQDFDTWPFDKKIAYQNTELQRFLAHANQNSPFYKQLYQAVDLSSITTPEALSQLPMVDKELLRQNMDEVAAISKKDAVISKTGGTTGVSLKVYVDPNDRMRRMAMLDHFKSRVGFEHRVMKRASFSSKHLVPPRQKQKVFWRYNASCKQMLYSVFHLSEANMPHYIASLNKFKPDALDSNLSPIRDIANYIKRHHIKIDFQLKAIFPTAESLMPEDRELFSEVFGVKTYDQYASGELAPFITECPHGRLHIEHASGIFEHFEPNSDEVLVTSFTSHGTPLIRYRIGDAVVLDTNAAFCSCGIESVMATEIIGRKADFLYSTDGAKIYNVSSLVKNIPNAVIRIQVKQDKIGEALALLEIDKNHYKPEYDDIFRRDFAYRVGSDTKLTIQHVDSIPRERSGKFSLIKNTVKL